MNLDDLTERECFCLGALVGTIIGTLMALVAEMFL